MTLYPYIGPARLLARVGVEPPGTPIPDLRALRLWLLTRPERTGEVTVTYTVSARGTLTLADRHVEHVVCAGGSPVLAAGELTLVLLPRQMAEVGAVTNQSTGYCPAPTCWPAVAQALAAAGLTPPAGLTVALVFRRCAACQQINIIKDGWWACAACSAPLEGGDEGGMV